ncbi:hypothetical protein FBZ81_119105, partial [Azospirillum brasilense]
MRWTGLFAFGAALLSALAATPAAAVDFSKSAAEYGRDCLKFRVRAITSGPKEAPHGTTQTPQHSGCA